MKYPAQRIEMERKLPKSLPVITEALESRKERRPDAEGPASKVISKDSGASTKKPKGKTGNKANRAGKATHPKSRRASGGSWSTDGKWSSQSQSHRNRDSAERDGKIRAGNVNPDTGNTSAKETAEPMQASGGDNSRQPSNEVLDVLIDLVKETRKESREDIQSSEKRLSGQIDDAKQMTRDSETRLSGQIEEAKQITRDSETRLSGQIEEAKQMTRDSETRLSGQIEEAKELFVGFVKGTRKESREDVQSSEKRLSGQIEEAKQMTRDSEERLTGLIKETKEELKDGLNLLKDSFKLVLGQMKFMNRVFLGFSITIGIALLTLLIKEIF